MAIFYFINWIVAAETIEGGNYSREEPIRGNTVYDLTKFLGNEWTFYKNDLNPLCCGSQEARKQIRTACHEFFPLTIANHDNGNYGNTGCGVSSGGYKIRKIFA